jgi:hypothetical protein
MKKEVLVNSEENPRLTWPQKMLRTGAFLIGAAVTMAIGGEVLGVGESVDIAASVVALGGTAVGVSGLVVGVIAEGE